MIKELSSEDFDEFISKGKTIVDFWATWCNPCKIMAPYFEKASKEFKEVKFGKLDVDEYSDLAGKYGIRSIPTTIFFRDGEIVERHTGILDLEEIKEIVDEVF